MGLNTDQIRQREEGLERGLVQTIFRPTAIDLLSRVDLVGRRVLDLGCGSGVVSRLAVERGAREVVGVDILAEAVAVARSTTRASHVRFVVANPFEEGVMSNEAPFDVVVLHHVLEQVDDGALQTAATFLEPKGRLLASTWWVGNQSDCPAYDFIYRVAGFAPNAQFLRSSDALPNMTEGAGLSVDEHGVADLWTAPVANPYALFEQWVAGSTARFRTEDESWRSRAEVLASTDLRFEVVEDGVCIPVRQSYVVATR